jgi:hypothetical protein
MAVAGEMNVPHTGSFLSSPPEGMEGCRGPLPGLGEEARNMSPNPLRKIPITDRKTVMTRTTAIISRIARNIIYLLSLTGARAPLRLSLLLRARLAELSVNRLSQGGQHRLRCVSIGTVRR